MVIGRDAVLIKHEGKKSRSQKYKEMERDGKWEEVLKEMIESVNKDDGQDAIESE